MQNEPSGTFILSLARGLEVLGAFNVDAPSMTLSEVAQATGLTRATARRFLLTLADLGYVRSDGRQFTLAPRVLGLGFSYLSGLSIPKLAQPHLESVSRILGESTSASILDGIDIVYIARVPTRRIMTVGISIGTRFPAYATSMGRVLLAGLPNDRLETLLGGIAPAAITSSTLTTVEALRAELEAVRENGFSLVDQELEEGLRSLAVPLHQSEAVVAAINVSTSVSTTSLERMRDEMLPAMLNAAAAIDHDLALASGQIV
jgi:IclR family pca regulon transcriptional regulator